MLFASPGSLFKLKNKDELYEKDKSIYIRDREHSEEAIQGLQNEIKDIKDEHIDLKVTQAKIDTELKGINLGITEIKAMLLKHID